ncbi:MAG: hypothetical protein DRP00_04980 [Candidatus Aenigmatarchaeota archaeon]|nr:MAG: hypothetical protein DRP00_04980 [Candidatus Aenigmarchaeota archaeon]
MENEYTIRVAESKEFWSELVAYRGYFVVRLEYNKGGIVEESCHEYFKDADDKFKEYMKLYDMREWSEEKIKKTNTDLSLLDIVQMFFEVGDYLEPDMDTKLEEFKTLTGIAYQYNNLYSNVSGFLAKVEFTRDKEKVVMFVEGDDLGHLVKHIGRE